MSLKAEPMMTTGEVAKLFKVSKVTIIRWIDAGKLTGIRTPGGHHRVREAEVIALAAECGIRVSR